MKAPHSAGSFGTRARAGPRRAAPASNRVFLDFLLSPDSGIPELAIHLFLENGGSMVPFGNFRGFLVCTKVLAYVRFFSCVYCLCVKFLGCMDILERSKFSNCMRFFDPLQVLDSMKCLVCMTFLGYVYCLYEIFRLCVLSV